MRNTVLITCPRCGYMIYGRMWRCPDCGDTDNKRISEKNRDGLKDRILAALKARKSVSA